MITRTEINDALDYLRLLTLQSISDRQLNSLEDTALDLVELISSARKARLSSEWVDGGTRPEGLDNEALIYSRSKGGTSYLWYADRIDWSSVDKYYVVQ